MAIARKTWIDDDGSGLTGTPINNAALQGDIYDPIDAAIAVVTPPLPGWTRIPFNPADFSAVGAMTWAVAAGNIVACDYKIDAQKTAFLRFDFANTTIGGTLGNQLFFALPTVLAPKAGGLMFNWNTVGAVSQFGVISLLGAPGQKLALFMTASFGTNWAAGTARISAELFYEIP